jgi:hypothetical protein
MKFSNAVWAEPHVDTCDRRGDFEGNVPAVAPADVALAHLPRFVVYNGPQRLGKGRENPHPPRQTFHSWHHANRGEKR